MYDEFGLDVDRVVQFDPNRLDVEWCGQPALRMYWGAKLAEAKADLAEAKANLDVVQAEIDRDIRSDPAKYNLDKITENSIRNVVVVQDRYRKALGALVDAQHSVDVLQSVVSAVDHRKSALEELVKLRLSDYYSECRVPEGFQGRMDEIRKSLVRSGRRRGEG